MADHNPDRSTKDDLSPGYWYQQRCLIAGGTNGFGLILAKTLCRYGATVMLIGRSADGVRNAIALCETEARTANNSTQQVHGLTADLNQPGEGERVVAHCLQKLGGCDSFFFCIGQSSRSAILNLPPNEIRRSIEANLMTAVEVTQAVAETVCRARGHLVFISSLAGKFVTPAMGNYAIGKSSLAAFVEAVRLEAELLGGHVLLVSPGPIARNIQKEPNCSFNRYDSEVVKHGLRDIAKQPGGGASLRLLNATRLAQEVLLACRKRAPELVRPKKAMLLAGFIAWFPSWGRKILHRYTSNAYQSTDEKRLLS
ncbi:MAG: SDR family NAD(P)-dependent oxidoreductase [Planctomycetaceae bacterium]|nr:SDR family NAD(P)-dependent oxidoreductase [Planctomycetaceae bacterium]